MKTIKTLRGAYGTKIIVKRDEEWDEYQCHIPGSPDATYHTDDLEDALQTANCMLKDLEIRCMPVR